MTLAAVEKEVLQARPALGEMAPCPKQRSQLQKGNRKWGLGPALMGGWGQAAASSALHDSTPNPCLFSCPQQHACTIRA
jgi:hypothetical protein